MRNDDQKYPDISKQTFATNFIRDFDAKPLAEPSAIFMAGLPGAGKTEFSKALLYIINQKAIRIDMDEIASRIKGYRPEIADQYREPATRLLNRVYDKVLEDRLEFIMDGTFGSKNAIKNVKRALGHNYSIKIVYIQQDPKVAWKFTLARKKVEHRSINIDGFIAAYFNTIDNLIKLRPLIEECDKITVDIVVKDNNSKIVSWIENIKSDLDVLLKSGYNRDTLRKYIND